MIDNYKFGANTVAGKEYLSLVTSDGDKVFVRKSDIVAVSPDNVNGNEDGCHLMLSCGVVVKIDNDEAIATVQVWLGSKPQ